MSASLTGSSARYGDASPLAGPSPAGYRAGGQRGLSEQRPENGKPVVAPDGVQEYLDRPQPPRRLLDDAPASLRVGQVGGYHLKVTAMLADLLSELRQPVLVDVRRQDPGSQTGEREGGRPAQPARSRDGDEELAYGLRSVAAPVRGENGAVVAGANVALQSGDWPAARITRELRPMVLEACEEISRLLGYRGR